VLIGLVILIIIGAGCTEETTKNGKGEIEIKEEPTRTSTPRTKAPVTKAPSVTEQPVTSSPQATGSPEPPSTTPESVPLTPPLASEPPEMTSEPTVTDLPTTTQPPSATDLPEVTTEPPTTTSPPTTTQPPTSSPTPTPPPTTPPPLGKVEFEYAIIDDWDGDNKIDGIETVIYPYNILGGDARVDGTIEFALYYQKTEIDPVTNATTETTVKLQEWEETITKDEGGAVGIFRRLEFSSSTIDTVLEEDFFLGELRAKLISSDGTFEATIDV
jgi:hypothetical protein